MTKLSKKDYCIYFVDLSHLSPIERRAAATWAVNHFGIESVDVMHPKEQIGKYGVTVIPGFWFGRERDAVWFTLKWSR